MLLTATRLQQHATTASYLLFHLVVGCCFILYCYVFEVLVPNVHSKPFPCFSGQWGSILIWSSCHLPETLAIFVSYLAFGSYCFNVRSASEIVDEKRKFLEKNFRVQQQLGSKVCWLLTWCEVGWFMICILIRMVDSGCARTCWRVRRTRSPSMGLLGWILISLSCMLHAYVSCENAKSCQPR